MMLRDVIDVMTLAQPTHAVIDAVVVHEREELGARARWSEARVRLTHREGEGQHGDDRDQGEDTAGRHVGRRLLSGL